MRRYKKAISPLIATVILIAFTMTIGSILASWATSFMQGQTAATETKATARIKCAYGDLHIERAVYNHTATKLSVWVENQAGTQDTVLSNITFSAIMKNASTFVYAVACSCASLDLSPAETKVYFNSSITDGCNIDYLRVSSNCPDAYEQIAGAQIEMSGC